MRIFCVSLTTDCWEVCVIIRTSTWRLTRAVPLSSRTRFLEVHHSEAPLSEGSPVVASTHTSPVQGSARFQLKRKKNKQGRKRSSWVPEGSEREHAVIRGAKCGHWAWLVSLSHPTPGSSLFFSWLDGVKQRKTMSHHASVSRTVSPHTLTEKHKHAVNNSLLDKQSVVFVTSDESQRDRKKI